MKSVKTKTAMAAAFERAGFDVPNARLDAAIIERHRRGCDEAKIRLAIGLLVLKDRELLDAMVDRTIRRVIHDEKDGGRGQTPCDPQRSDAPPPSADLPGEGHNTGVDRSRAANPRQSDEEGGGQMEDDHHFEVASPSSPDANNRGHSRYEIHTKHAHVVGAPNDLPPIGVAARGAAAKAIATASQHGWLLHYRVPNGPTAILTPIGNLGNLRRRLMRETGDHFHALVVLRAMEIATARYAEANPNATAADVLSQDEIAAIETSVGFDKVKRNAAAWIRKYPEFELSDAV